MSLSIEIINGQHDDDLEAIKTALDARQNALDAINVRDIKNRIAFGDIVRIKPSAPIRPKYLLGIELRVDKVNQKTVSASVVNPDVLPSRRFANGIRCQIEFLEVVDTQY